MPKTRAKPSSQGKNGPVARLLGAIPNRLQLAGGWIDQPFVSRVNPKPPGSMVVVQIEPNFRPMCRSGIASSTRIVAMDLWKGKLPHRPKETLVRELYHAENTYKAEPSGSQDMIGLIYPGINRLDYDIAHDGGVFPRHIESCTSASVAHWLERVLHLIPVEPRPEGYNPLVVKALEPRWIAKLGQSGRDCYDAIVNMDVVALGKALNLCLECWDMLFPALMRHESIRCDLMALAAAYQHDYPGATYSGAGGGYLIVVSEVPVPGSFQVQIRTGDT